MNAVRLMAWRGLPIAPEPARWYLAAIVGVMAYLAALAGIGLIALSAVRRDWDRALGDTLTLQLPADTSPARIEVVIALLRQTPGIAEARPLEPSETARLLEPWLGKSAPVEIMPLPRLVDIRIDPAGALDFDGLQQRLKSVAPEAQLEDHRVWLARLLSFTSRLRGFAAAIVAAAAAFAAISAAVIVSGTLARDRRRLALLQVLGAEDLDIVARLAVPAAGMGLLGGAVGALAAAGTLWAIARAVQVLGVASVAPAVADPAVILLLSVVTVAGGIVAAAGAASAAWRHLARLP